MENIFNSLYPNHEKSLFNFKNKFSFEKRYGEANRIRLKYPNRIPIICQLTGKNLPDLDRKKYEEFESELTDQQKDLLNAGYTFISWILKILVV